MFLGFSILLGMFLEKSDYKKMKLEHEEVTLSQFLVNKEYRLYNRIHTRIKALKFQLNIHLDKDNFDKKKIEVCEKEIDQLLEIQFRLVNNSFICNKTLAADLLYKSIYYWFKKYPKNIEEHSMLTLGQYIPKKSSDYNNLRKLEKEKQYYVKYNKKSKIKEINNKIQDEKFKIEYIKKFKKS
ncbi:hypothetical protein [Eel River basin pequenovirus]|uniref:hypothetical protein n=1 Tax=Eel River basin pequenovirus TaxID=1609634 RepID=UPI0005B24696|nr:hypothetical protein [Eel River basin pequenovirus]AJK28221.1 hypothetical protein [Eel River basin pequenovirus]